MNLTENKAPTAFFKKRGQRARIFLKRKKAGSSVRGQQAGLSARGQQPGLNKKTAFLNKRGQGLIEYLILVALMGVATIGIVRTLNQTVKSRFANAIYALQGKNQKAKTHTLKKEEYQRSDLSNFMSGSASADNKKDRKKR